jgi:hypothetical protein
MKTKKKDQAVFLGVYVFSGLISIVLFFKIGQVVGILFLAYVLLVGAWVQRRIF